MMILPAQIPQVLLIMTFYFVLEATI